MNAYLLALVGVIAILVVGFLIYGVLFKDRLKDAMEPMTPMRLVVAFVGMYLISWVLTVLFKDITFVDGATGVMKGLELGLAVGIFGFALPLFIDSSYLKSKMVLVQTVIINWVLAFAVLGMVIGWLA